MSSAYRQVIADLGLNHESQTDKGALYALLIVLDTYDSGSTTSGNPYANVLSRLEPLIGNGFYFREIKKAFATASFNYDKSRR
jgi:hypothetical protein